MLDTTFLSPESKLAMIYAPRTLHEAFTTLLVFDGRLGTSIAAAKEPQLARIRLAWWRDELASFNDSPSVAADPVLAAMGDMLRLRDVTLGQLVRIIEGWAKLLDDLPLECAMLSEYAKGRGGGIVAAAAAIAGSTAPERAGEAYALADFARKCTDVVSRDRALGLVGEIEVETLPRALRPFALIDDWARRDSAQMLAGRAPISLRRRALSALTFAVTGPR